ncbi:hypothetical protein [Okeania hirsuta]|uniref:hypothetical protein n=1 Tax=Okeania hirsuta TaxID=1458930 RepID=UPI000F525C55|nr:hypothetical protein [Okeania hirsuta]
MHIIRRIEQILIDLRPVFSRDATYEWFVILIWGILLCSQHRAVTSDLNAVGLTQNYYTQGSYQRSQRCGTNTKLLHPSFTLVSFPGN